MQERLVGIRELETNPSGYLRAVRGGTTLVLMDGRRLVARVIPEPDAIADQGKAVHVLQTMLRAEHGRYDVTVCLIVEKVDWLLRHGSRFGIDPDRVYRDGVIDELVRRFSIRIPSDT